jgi:hypothetical protein
MKKENSFEFGVLRLAQEQAAHGAASFNFVFFYK